MLFAVILPLLIVTDVSAGPISPGDAAPPAIPTFLLPECRWKSPASTGSVPKVTKPTHEQLQLLLHAWHGTMQKGHIWSQGYKLRPETSQLAVVIFSLSVVDV
ncbi:hypothetical protein J6590_033568 [Homalodisca vitripennis]|nr:hypothetical protein J6590_033568 [Homalodisca vitripennis]